MVYLKLKNLGFKFYKAFKHNYVKRTITKQYRAKTNNTVSLTKMQKKTIKAFYAPYCGINNVFHRFYLQATGEFSEKFLPASIYFNKIDEHFNATKEALYLDNKCYYKKLLPGINQPVNVIARIGKFWFDENDNIIDYDNVKEIVSSQEELFLKTAVDSRGGKGVCYISNKNGDIVEQFEKFKCKCDFVAQKPIRQHKDMAAINMSSVNTIRAISMLTENEVKIYSIIIRAGQKGEKCDNATGGGISIGVDKNGRLKKLGYDLRGNRWEKHPTNGFVFEGHAVPSFESVKDLIKKMHPMVPHFRLVSWDVAIDEEGSPILLETNLCQGSLDVHQLNNGPLFGDDTEKVLNEVFNK